jgi:hypothetical protein
LELLLSVLLPLDAMSSPSPFGIVAALVSRWKFEAPPGIDPELWRERRFVLDEVKQWRDGYLKAKERG